MRVSRVADAGAARDEGWVGAVLARDVLDDGGAVALSKGHRLVPDDAAAVSHAGELHVVWLDRDDVGEDTAATTLAQAVAGPGVDLHPPVESQVRLSAASRGVVRVDVQALAAVNGVDGVTVFTLADGTPVDAQRTVGGAKITALAIARARLDEALARAAEGAPVLRVRAFDPLRMGAVVRQRLGAQAQAKLEANLRVRAEWFGGSLGAIAHVGDDIASIAAAIREATAAADIVLAAGVASVDPLDATWQALLEAGATPIRRGLAVHPGSSYWLASCEGALVIGVASCGMLSRRSALDLLLVRRFSGEPVDDAFLAGLGHGGLLGPEAAWRIPPYGGALQATDD